jgi:GT2 family glycosyltransferase
MQSSFPARTSHEPKVSVAIVTWESSAYLPHCLANLSLQTFRDFEVIVVDNGSTDGGVTGLQEKTADLDLYVKELGTNRGFAAANNIAARLARGEWLALLNADAFPEPTWLDQLMTASARFPGRYFFTSRQLQADNPACLDGEGDAYHVSGMVWRRNYGVPVYPVEVPQEVFSACGAAAMFRRQEFLDAGGFDESYFAYLEDIDLGFRLRLLGARCLFVPGAVVHHVGSASTGKRSDFAVYHGFRNRIWTFLKDMPAPLFWRYLPLHAGAMLFFLALCAWRGQGKIAFRALWDAVAGMPGVLARRKAVQIKATASWRDLRAFMSTGLMEPYRETLRRRRSDER